VDTVANLPVRIEGRTFRISDFAKVTRGYIDPAEFKMRFNGKDVIGLGVTMSNKGDILALGKLLESTMANIEGNLPIGVDVEKIADQSKVVNSAIGEFLRTFWEALAAVLLVSFLSLGMRAGSVVALTVPIVLAGTLLCMLLFGLEIHRISLGALILALGLLVDDAMIAIEMMAQKLEQGWIECVQRPMLTGYSISHADRHLITVAGFLPVGLAKSSAGEYTVAIFQVVVFRLFFPDRRSGIHALYWLFNPQS